MQTGFCGCTPDSGGTTGFWWCIYRILLVYFELLKYWSTCIRGLSVETVITDGLSRVCGRSVLKRVCNVTGMVPWRWPLACYSCFIFYNVYVCLHFAVTYGHLHRTVISPSLLWKSSRFGVIFSIPDSNSLHRILLLHYNGFCDH